jgi:phage-related protein
MKTNDSEDETDGPTIKWDKSVRKEMGAIPAAVQQEFQVSLEMVLLGLRPAMRHEKLKSAGAGVIELKRNGSPAYRCMYVVDKKGNVVVLHVASKTMQGQDKQLVKTTSQRRKRLVKDG